MAEVFSESEQGVFRLAKQLELCGERALALELCEKCVRRAALCRGQDVLVLFYGENVYRGLHGIGDAMEYVFIARCAARVYDAVAEKTSVAPSGTSARSSTKTAPRSRRLSTTVRLCTISWRT